MYEFSTTIYVYIVVIDDGFYMESDFSIARVFLRYKDAFKCLEKLEHKHKHVYIEKRKLFL